MPDDQEGAVPAPEFPTEEPPTTPPGRDTVTGETERGQQDEPDPAGRD